MKTFWLILSALAMAMLIYCSSFLFAASALRTASNLLIDTNGKSVYIRGFSIVSSEVYLANQAYSYKGQKGLNALKAVIYDIRWNLRANAIRIPVDPTTLSGRQSGVKGWFTDSTSYWEKYLKPAVTYAIEQNLYVIIDFHLVGPYNETTKDQAIAFWKFIIDKKFWNNHRNVIFEIYSGPSWWNTSDIPGEVSGCNFAATEYKRFRDQVNQPIVDFIRNAKCNNIIIAGSPVWNALAVHAVDYPLSGGNIVYGLHLYPNQNDYVRMYRKSDYSACMSALVPTIATEWGFQTFDNSDLDKDYCQGSNYYMTGITSLWGPNTLAWMEENNIGWMACNYDYYQVYCGPRMFRNSNCSLEDTTTNYFIKMVKNGLLKNPEPVAEEVSSVAYNEAINNIVITDNWIFLPADQVVSKWDIFNLFGQTVLSGKLSTPNIEIGILESGCYLLILQNGTKLQSQKFIKY